MGDAEENEIAGTHIARTDVVVRLSRDEVWHRLSDLSLAHHYVPGIVRSEITTDQTTGVGAARKVYRGENDAMDETVVLWDEGRGFTLRLHYGDGGPPFPFSRAWFHYRIEDGDHTATRLSLALEYDLRWGGAGRLMGMLGTHWMIGRQIDAVGRNLKRFYEQGS